MRVDSESVGSTRFALEMVRAATACLKAMQEFLEEDHPLQDEIDTVRAEIGQIHHRLSSDLAEYNRSDDE